MLTIPIKWKQKCKEFILFMILPKTVNYLRIKFVVEVKTLQAENCESLINAIEEYRNQ